MAKRAKKPAAPDVKPRCGIVMPISAMPDYPKSHWEDVLQIIREALQDDFLVKMVSDADEVRVIQGRIVQSLYDDPIVVCDVSGRNANVMFEFGMRLAFDRPVVSIKDELTPFSFDSSPLEHLVYPKSLSYKEICSFKELLARKVKATLADSKKQDYQSFLKTFAPRVVAGRLQSKQVTELEFFSEKLDEILGEVNRLRNLQLQLRPRTKSGFPVESLFGQAELLGESEKRKSSGGRETPFEVGQRVIVKEGALKGLEGVVEAVSSDNRLLLGVKFLGKGKTMMVQDFQVEPAPERQS